MNELSTDVRRKTLNIFQKIKLNIYRRNTNISFEKYNKLPEYIKSDEIIGKHLKESNQLSLNEILQIPHNILSLQKQEVQNFSLSEQAQLIKQGYIGKEQFSNDEKNAIIMEDVVNSRNYSAFSDWKLDTYEVIKFFEFLRANQQSDEIIINLMKYCDEKIRLEIVEKRPELLKSLSENEQIKSLMQNPNYFAYMSPELQVKYMETDSKYINKAAKEAQKKFVEVNARNITKLNKENQIQVISEKPQLLEYLLDEQLIREIAIKIFKNDDEKIEMIDRLADEGVKVEIIKTIQDDDKKLDAMDELTYEDLKAQVMQTIRDDDKKIEAMDRLTREDLKARVMSTIQDDDKKLEAIDSLTKEIFKPRVMSTIQDDDKKLEAIDTLTEEDNKAGVMRTIQDDDKKLEAIDKLTKEDAKAKVMQTIQDDDKKIEALDKLSDKFRYQKADIMSTIQDDDKKIEAIDKQTEEYIKVEIMKDIQDDDKKIEALDKLTEEDTKAEVMQTIQDDDKKIKAIDKLTKEDAKAKVMQTIQDDDKKIEAIDKLTDEDTKAKVMQTIQDDDKKLEAIDKLTKEDAKAKVMQTIQDDDKKLEAIDNLTDEDTKAEVMKTLRSDNKKLKGIYKLTDEDAKAEVIGTIHNDNFKIEAAKKIYSLNDRQMKILEQLKEKNEELLETIDFRILDGRYSDLEEKLTTITCYQDIQAEILHLDEQKYNIFIQTLKEYEKRNEKWINYTSKVISNLYDDQYKDLLNDIEDKNLTEDEIRNLGKIISQENIFNIKNLDEAKNYKKIKEKVCDIIIYDGNSEELKKYPKIMSLSELNRKKMAVLQKIYGQTLKEVNYLLETYGADIENLTVTSENEASILYMKSLQIIKNTEDIELLQNIYEKCETIEIDNVRDIEMIEEQLKDSYLETYNKKLYKPKESDLIDIIEEDGKKIPIYNAGTDFSMSISSIGAYYADWGIMNYKEEWNRPRIASQGYCASYIRNDMLGTAPIKEVVYGFKSYDRGTLMKSGRCDILSNAKSFLPDAVWNVKFLSESTQIDNTCKGYNEMLFNRFNTNGERKQPDYIVFIKEQETLERKHLGT